MFNQDTFGGASVTIPLKLDVMPLLNALSPSAKAIGAVNTVVVGTDGYQRILCGDNTDWLGILRPIQRRLTVQNPVALIIGAGGTAMAAAYAMQHLRAELYIYNRTFTKAEALAERFNGTALKEVQLPRIDIVIGTIPAGAQTSLPDGLFISTPIVLDAAYRPAMTPLLLAAQSAGCPCIQGAEMLYEQALEQFKLWTKHTVPPSIMSAIAFASADQS